MELIPVQWIAWTMHLKEVITIKKKQLDLITVKRSFFWKETLSYYRLIYLGYYERSKKQILWEKSWCLKLVLKQNPFIVKIQTVIVRGKDQQQQTNSFEKGYEFELDLDWHMSFKLWSHAEATWLRLLKVLMPASVDRWRTDFPMHSCFLSENEVTVWWRLERNALNKLFN